jgi:uncharacterized SAM-binding protein YcdF (DUF218 family)
MALFRRRAWIWLGGLALLAAGGLAVRGAGAWLVVADPLARVPAIAVLGGDFPFRAVEAARLYGEGWAPEVWLQRGVVPERDALLARLGMVMQEEESANRAVLVRLGVPPGAVRLLPGEARSTAEELQLVGREAVRARAQAVIVVTSKPHTRRVRLAWRRLVGDRPAAIVRPSREDPFRPERWWASTRDALAVTRELLGLANLWAGLPVPSAPPP